jgi:hypothetical protein
LLRAVDVQRGEMDGIYKNMRQALEDLDGAVDSATAIPLQDMRDSMEELIPTLAV